MKKTEILFRTANVASINGSYDKVRNPNRFPTRWGGTLASGGSETRFSTFSLSLCALCKPHNIALNSINMSTL